MEFTINRDDFLKVLQRVQGVVSIKGPMPILANVLIEADESGITVYATNLDMGLKGSYGANVASTGSVTVQAKKLHDIVRELPSSDIHLKVDDDGRCRIASGKSKFNLATIDPEEFPSFPEHDESKLIGLEGEMLGDMIRKTSYAISQDETRLTLNGAFFEVSPTNIRLVATDGHRLAFVEREGAFGVGEPTTFIVARKAIQELTKIISEIDGDLKFLKQDNHVIFVKGSLRLSIRLIDGAYPNYEQVIPKSSDKTARLSANEFSHALRRVATLADEKSHMIRLTFSEKSLTLVSEGGELGEAKDEIPIDFEGDEISIGLNAQYLLDVLGILGGDEVVVNMQDQLRPVMAKTPEDPGLLCIIMPMRI